MSLEILSDTENKLLERREVICIYKGLSGKITRQEAAQVLAAQVKVDAKKVYPIKLATSAGSREVNGVLYIYQDERRAKKHLPKHLLIRLLPKEAREKAKEEKKEAKAPAPK